jgi:hypothetical protein
MARSASASLKMADALGPLIAAVALVLGWCAAVGWLVPEWVTSTAVVTIAATAAAIASRCVGRRARDRRVQRTRNHPGRVGNKSRARPPRRCTNSAAISRPRLPGRSTRAASGIKNGF